MKVFEYFDLSETFYKTCGSIVQAYYLHHNPLVVLTVFLIASASIFMALSIEIFLKRFKEKGYKEYKSIAGVSSLLLWLYITAIITTSANNIGPMLFGGVLALWITLLQDDQKHKKS
ncbi:hypothetical protein [Lysinibacillus xylanilyticus]|uniref:hypothetical protein n=1 Tax=Lysinibacillus xylanilyticus TaxID=582475 RepID=UPI003821592C